MDNELIHLNNASAGIKSQQTQQVLLEYQALEQQLGPYEAEEFYRDERIKVKSIIAGFIQATSAEDIAFFDSATRVFNQLCWGIDWKKGDEIITTELEYGSNWLNIIFFQRKYDLTVHIVPLRDGLIDLDFLQAKLTSKTRLVSMVHLGSHGGLLQPITEVGRLLKKSQALYCVDAAQSIGQVSIDVKAIGCDVLYATGRKFLCGPRAIAFAYISKEKNLESPFANLWSIQSCNDELHWQGAAQKFEQKEIHFAGVLALGKAIELISRNWLAINTCRTKTCEFFLEHLYDYLALKNNNTFIHSLNFFENNEKVFQYLKHSQPKVNVAYWSQVSSPLMADFKKGFHCIRVSPNHNNTKQQLEYFLTSIRKIMG